MFFKYALTLSVFFAFAAASSGFPSEKLQKFVNAAEKGDLQEVTNLLETSPQITEDDAGYVLKYAALNGHLHILRFLLPQYYALIKPCDIYLVLRNAIWHGYLPVFAFLLEQQNVPMPIHSAGKVLKDAASLGHLHIVDFLLKHCIDITPDHVGTAVV